MPSRSFSPPILLMAALTASAFPGARAVRADLRVVTQINVTGWPAGADSQPSSTFSQRLTTCFQGGRARTDEPDGGILLFDSRAGEVYQLDPRSRTYRETAIKKIEDFKAAFPASAVKRMSIDSQVAVAARTDTAVFLGASAVRNTVSGEAHVTVSPVREERRRDHGFSPYGLGNVIIFGGLREDRGDQGGRGAGDRQRRLVFPVYDIAGALWEPVQPLSADELPAFPLAVQLAWGYGPLVEGFTDQLARAGAVPLHAQITATQLYPGGADGAANPPDRVVTTTFDVVSFSNAPCPPQLFQVPADYVLDSNPVFLPQLPGPAFDPTETAR